MTGDLVPVENWEAAELLPTIRHMCANGATDPEWKIFVATARVLGLNPMLKQIWCVKNKKRPDLPAQIYASRDGFLAIAHRSGQFNGMKSGVIRNDAGEVTGAFCQIWRKDMDHPFEVEILRAEYDTKEYLWADKPATMCIKVAEAHCLRRAFDICGVYCPEEMPEPGEVAMREVPDTSRTTAFGDNDTAGSPVRCGYCGKDMDAHPNERITSVPGHGWRCLTCRAALEKSEPVEAGV